MAETVTVGDDDLDNVVVPFEQAIENAGKALAAAIRNYERRQLGQDRSQTALMTVRSAKGTNRPR